MVLTNKNGAYQAVHFGVGNVIGLLGSYLKWTNKMSQTLSLWGVTNYSCRVFLFLRLAKTTKKMREFY